MVRVGLSSLMGAIPWASGAFDCSCGSLSVCVLFPLPLLLSEFALSTFSCPMLLSVFCLHPANRAPSPFFAPTRFPIGDIARYLVFDLCSQAPLRLFRAPLVGLRSKDTSTSEALSVSFGSQPAVLGLIVA